MKVIPEMRRRHTKFDIYVFIKVFIILLTIDRDNYNTTDYRHGFDYGKIW